MKIIRLAIALIPIIVASLAAIPAAADLPLIATVPFNQNKVDVSGGAFILGSGIENCTAAYTGAIRYNSATPRIEFCDGTSWKWLVKTQTSITAPAGSGYFVMSYGTWNGNMGGLAGADAKCLADLTAHTGWMGYAEAHARGQDVASKVHAFICAAASCNTLTPLTTYYFADTNNAAAGGANFTTDGSSIGPGDTNNWAAANYFGSTYFWWSDRDQTSSTAWTNTNAARNCISWTNGTNFAHGNYGNTSNTDTTRWKILGAGNCDSVYHLLCYVNP